jgi:hypothetical protein
LSIVGVWQKLLNPEISRLIEASSMILLLFIELFLLATSLTLEEKLYDDVKIG